MKEIFWTIEDKIKAGTRISGTEARFIFEEAGDSELSHLSTLVRNRHHQQDEATYLIMAIVNYTNVCVAKCDYCAFYRLPHEKGTYLLSVQQVCEKVAALKSLGGKLIGFNGGFHPKLKLSDYAELFKEVRATYPELEFYEMTVAEFMFSCKLSKISYDDGAALMKASGTKWITGGGAEVLDDAFRKRHSPGKYTVEDYYRAQEAILSAGLGSTATMVIGFDETLDERMNHLESLRDFQDRVGGALSSFLCWTYKPYQTELGGTEISTREYLRWLAVSRIYLDNFVNIRTSVLTKNQDALKGLLFGANDFDLPTEDEVTQKAGATISLQFEELLQSARDLGFKVINRSPWVPQFGRQLDSYSSRISHLAKADVDSTLH